MPQQKRKYRVVVEVTLEPGVKATNKSVTAQVDSALDSCDNGWWIDKVYMWRCKEFKRMVTSILQNNWPLS
jgi:hypothetical protein